MLSLDSQYPLVTIPSRFFTQRMGSKLHYSLKPRVLPESFPQALKVLLQARILSSFLSQSLARFWLNADNAHPASSRPISARPFFRARHKRQSSMNTDLAPPCRDRRRLSSASGTWNTPATLRPISSTVSGPRSSSPNFRKLLRDYFLFARNRSNTHSTNSSDPNTACPRTPSQNVMFMSLQSRAAQIPVFVSGRFRSSPAPDHLHTGKHVRNRSRCLGCTYPRSCSTARSE